MTSALQLLDAQQRKRLATVQARAALIGATLTQIDGDNGAPALILTRWSLTRHFDLSQLDELEALLGRMGAPA